MRSNESYPSLTVVRQSNKSDDSETPFLGKRSTSSSYQVYRRHSSAQFYGETDSHQYEQDESEVWKHHQLQRWSIYCAIWMLSNSSNYNHPIFFEGILKTRVIGGPLQRKEKFGGGSWRWWLDSSVELWLYSLHFSPNWSQSSNLEFFTICWKKRNAWKCLTEPAFYLFSLWIWFLFSSRGWLYMLSLLQVDQVRRQPYTAKFSDVLLPSSITITSP